MMGPHPRRLIFATLLVGVLLVLFGACVGLLSGSRTIDNRYSVDIQTASGLNWTLWIPKASVPMSLTASGVAPSVRPINTAFGLMENVTGSGSAGLVWSLHRTFDTTKPTGHDTRSSVNLTAQEGPYFHIWRGDSAPNVTLEIFGTMTTSGSQLGERFDCGGPGYHSELSEGWNLVPSLPGDCVVIGDFMPWSDLIFPALSLAGASLIAVSAVVRFRQGIRP